MKDQIRNQWNKKQNEQKSTKPIYDSFRRPIAISLYSVWPEKKDKLLIPRTGGYSSGVECLPGIYKTLGSVPSTQKEKRLIRKYYITLYL
jgi:hypothetical protein